jgi:hypothetical protein
VIIPVLHCDIPLCYVTCDDVGVEKVKRAIRQLWKKFRKNYPNASPLIFHEHLPDSKLAEFDVTVYRHVDVPIRLNT